MLRKIAMFSLMTLLVSCTNPSTIPSNDSNTAGNLNFINLNFSSTLLDENDVAIDQNNLNLEVTRTYRLFFNAVPNQQDLNKLPSSPGLSSKMTITFATKELYDANQPRIVGEEFGSHPYTCSPGTAGSFVVVCGFNLENNLEQIIGDKIYFEIRVDSRITSSTVQPITLKIESLNSSYVYRIQQNSNECPGCWKWNFTLIRTNYELTPPQEEFLVEYGRIKLFIPRGASQIVVKGFVPNTTPSSLIFDDYPLSFLPGERELRINIFQVYLDAKNNDIAFVKNNPIEFHIIYMENQNYHMAVQTLTYDFTNAPIG
jgi:hypothetical protein